MKKRNLTIFITLIIFLSLSIISIPGCGKGKKAEDQKVIKIGAILPLTGTLSVFGESIKNTINLAVDKINKEGNMKMEIFYENSQNMAKEAIKAYHKLVKINGCQIIVPFLTSIVESAIPLAEKDNKLVLALTISPEVTKSRSSIRLFYDTFTETKRLVDYLKFKNSQKIVLIRCKDAASEYQVEKYLKPLLFQKNIELAAELDFEFREKDFKNILSPLAKLREEIDSVLLLGFGIDFPGIIIEFEKYDYLHKKNICGGIGMWEIPSNFPNKLLEGIVFTVPEHLVNFKESEFSKEYNSKYGGEQPYFITPYVYDNIRVLEIALSKLKYEMPTKANELKNIITNLKEYNGISGKIYFSSNGNTRVPIEIVKYKKNRDIVIVNIKKDL